MPFSVCFFVCSWFVALYNGLSHWQRFVVLYNGLSHWQRFVAFFNRFPYG